MYERTHVDLFTGLGGFSLAARACGVRTIAMCESDPRCQAFLAKAWPGVPVWADIRTFSLADAGGNDRESKARQQAARPESQTAAGSLGGADGYGSDVWLLTAGVPCQPASRAGKQRGKEDDRWLWPAALSVFAAIRPAWAIFENPPGIGDVGLTGILSDVAAQGYATRVFSLGACALGAPHRRMRYWIVCKRVGQAPNGKEHGPSASDGRCNTNLWRNYIWLPCADGKVRRAPDDSFRLVDGLHRSVLGALGNSIVWPVAAKIIQAMIQSEQ